MGCFMMFALAISVPQAYCTVITEYGIPSDFTALNIKLLEPLAQGASRFEKSLAPPKNPLAPNFFKRRKSE